MRRPALYCLLFCVFTVSSVQAQTAPQLARDYVRGPGGRLAVTIEPDNYPPSAPSSCSAAQGGPCAIDGIDVGWGSATDIGSGVAGYDGPGGFTTGFSYHDSNVSAGDCYSYSVSALDNAGLSGDLAFSNTVCIPICFEETYGGLFVPHESPRHRARFGNISFYRPGFIVRRHRVMRLGLIDLSKPRPLLVATGGGQ